MFFLLERKKISYFKRLRMEIDLYQCPPAAVLPEGYSWVRWEESLLGEHAETMFQAFQEEIDGRVFPSLASREGCLGLMTEIRRRPGFVAEATWLVAGPMGYCGTVQGICERSGMGSIQNVGVSLAHRSQGLGKALLLQTLRGFFLAGLGRAQLEVTAENEVAINLYRRVGFRKRKTIYKAAQC
jgi:GNAT superfamily N-acetyltransferase